MSGAWSGKAQTVGTGEVGGPFSLILFPSPLPPLFPCLSPSVPASLPPSLSPCNLCMAASGQLKFLDVSRRPPREKELGRNANVFYGLASYILPSHVHHSPRPTQIQEEQTQTEEWQHHTVRRTRGWDTLVWPSLKIPLATLCGVFVRIKWGVFQKTILQRYNTERKTRMSWGTLRRPVWTGTNSVAKPGRC